MIKILNKDFRELGKIEDGIIISDPPYNIDFKYNTYVDKQEENEYIEMIADLKKITDKIVLIGYPLQTMKYYVQALGYPDTVLAWCYNSNLPSKHYRLISFWNVEPNLKNDYQPYKNPNDKRVKALIAKGSKGARLYDWFSDIQLEKNVSKNKNGNIHPCPVPIKLMERIIKVTQKCSGGRQIYIDPFCGSGTSAIASYLQNVSFVGTEIDENYYNNSLELLENIKKGE